ncbi:GIY-YIG nuclease family protein [Candidatus Latescibacterota bacterium]
MIKLTDLIKLAGVELQDYKIHCATGYNPTPLEAFFDGTFGQWQERQNQENFKRGHILSIIHLENAHWLFAGAFSVQSVAPAKKKWRDGPCYKYSTEEISGLEHLVGRVIVHFDKNFRASYLRGERFADRLIVASIRDSRMTIGDFPGYKSVLLSYRMLKTIIRENNPSWRTALSNIAGVYLITDNATGKLYVGSAYGGEGIWQRWNSYAKTGHGGNKELRVLLREKGKGYAENFQYSLLEVCDLSASEDYVIPRETYWKTVLRSREYGLNKN